MIQNRQVSDEEIKQSADSLKYGYFLTSAVDGTNVNEAFQEMARIILSKSKKEEKEIKNGKIIEFLLFLETVDLSDVKKEKSGCAC